MPQNSIFEFLGAGALVMGFMGFGSSKPKNEMADTLTALDKSQAVIEFKPDGTILHANENFLVTMGYSLGEIKGKHHSMFAVPGFAETQEYKDFWKKLANGEFEAARYKRIGKGGKEVWIEASYNPIMDKNGRVYKVVKFATDITKQVLHNAKNQSMVDAIGRSQAVIHFNLDGTILEANENFLSVMGYSLDEIQGKHHSMFADAAYAASAEYKEFWAKLKRGEFHSGQYRRLGKGGKEIWIEASYNPIFDADGNPFMVTKFATDLTPRKEEHRALADAFESNVQSVVRIVADSSAGVQETAKGLASAAEKTSGLANAVATASEELSASVGEISSQVTHSVHTIDEAVEEAQRSEQLVASLLEATNKISQVTSLITDIAEQTNLLAMNATIEAARAGEAGKGFAVVASEVKKLAMETAKATDEIGGQISNIQSVSQSTASAISTINGVITRVNEISTAISGAVEEQAAATREVAVNIEGVQSAANETGVSSGTLAQTADDLSSQSADLQHRVEEFIQRVREM